MELTPRTAAPGPAPEAPDRRILGARTREELGLELRWPSLLTGLEPYLPAPGPGADEGSTGRS